MTIPEGFAPHPRKSPVTEPWEPIHAAAEPGGPVRLGLVVGPQHANARGFLHGGVVAALADNAMGLSLAMAMDPKPEGGLLTVSLTLDYLGAGRVGEWLEVRPRVLRAKGGLGFVDALVTADEATIARASATFRALEARRG